MVRNLPRDTARLNIKNIYVLKISDAVTVLGVNN